MTNLPEVMQTVVATPGATSWTEIRDADVPAPQAGEVLVRVAAFSLNRGELTLLRSRGDGWRPGQDIAGEVVALGPGVEAPAVGTSVAALVDWHGWAQYAVVRTLRLAPVPESLALPLAASLPLAGITALNVVRRAGSLLGARVLVTGAAGGVGQLVVQLARASGADVVAVARKAHGERLRGIGASVVEDVAAAEGPFALVCEGVGGPSLTAAIGKLAPDGVVVLYGASASEPAAVTLLDFAGAPEARVEPFFSSRYQLQNGTDIATLLGLAADGRLDVEIGFDADWSEVNAALDALAARRFSGKAVLRVGR